MKKIRLFIRTIKNYIYILRVIKRTPVIIQMVSEMMTFIDLTKEENRPMTQEIKLINTVGKDAKYSDFVHLWACTGTGNPAQRCRHLAARLAAAKEYLKLFQNGEFKEENKKELELFLKVMDLDK